MLDDLPEDALRAAAGEADPTSLASATRLRRRFGAEIAAAAVDQVVLRRRAVTKFGPSAAGMFFTRDGLEQATRPEVAAHHAAFFAASGAATVLDLGCGIGADAMALLRAGLAVIAVERDPRTAKIARANLDAVGAGRAEVVVADAEESYDELVGRADAVFCDPARRTGAGRLWRVADFSPSWTLVTRILGGTRPAAVKLGPALPHDDIPAGVQAEWLTDRGETVEATLYAGGGVVADRRQAVVMPDQRLVAEPGTPEVRGIGAVVYEPDGAVLRSGALFVLGRRLGAGLIDPQIAYLTADAQVRSPFAAAFAVRDVLPYKEKQLRGWLREHRIGRLEIKRRGLDLDPAVLRRRLRPSGPEAASMIITRTPAGARAILADRLPDTEGQVEIVS